MYTVAHFRRSHCPTGRPLKRKNPLPLIKSSRNAWRRRERFSRGKFDCLMSVLAGQELKGGFHLRNSCKRQILLDEIVCRDAELLDFFIGELMCPKLRVVAVILSLPYCRPSLNLWKFCVRSDLRRYWRMLSRGLEAIWEFGEIDTAQGHA